ncbi:FAD:protein FMN transferase [Roseibium denhamense]|uniref:FAD:protein FMN transferase n=1 Tax=Roseibium denhamense TaxID=76305 RepID=A0ABY1NGT4_9HYPH|nr:FAD:protein FMN transferase [Roseibium denhamense]SMP08691.1 thiamine biosynthesis lipoprotein [Roseibium denhamense]
MSLSLAACKGGSELVDFSGSTMGTTYTVTGVDHDRRVDTAALKAAVEKTLLDVNAQMSNWDRSSEVSRFNAATTTDPVSVSKGLAEVVRASQQVNRDSDGQFDITLGPVIEAWGFGAQNTGSREAPDQHVLNAALASAGKTGALQLDGNRIRKPHQDTQIHLPSIGKGYGVDQMAEVARSFGLSDFMVEIGGDIYVSGRNADSMKWQIGIETPSAMTRQAYKVASVSNMGMATSGDYRNYYERDGKRYSHIIDAHTGHPITHRTASVTVLADNTMLADAWATAMLVLGTGRGLEIANKLDLAAMFIDRNSNDLNKGFVTTSSDRFEALQA